MFRFLAWSCCNPFKHALSALLHLGFVAFTGLILRMGNGVDKVVDPAYRSFAAHLVAFVCHLTKNFKNLLQLAEFLCVL